MKKIIVLMGLVCMANLAVQASDVDFAEYERRMAGLEALLKSTDGSANLEQQRQLLTRVSIQVREMQDYNNPKPMAEQVGDLKDRIRMQWQDPLIPDRAKAVLLKVYGIEAEPK